MITLVGNEQHVREILIGVASGQLKTKRNGLISYKELWEQISEEPWGQFRTKDVVVLISRVSSFELERSRPPLNELVVPVRSREPREPWSDIRMHHRDLGLDVPYKSHADAQRACWEYWGNSPKSVNDDMDGQPVENSEAAEQAEEGYLQDRTVSFRSRNRELVAGRKRRDNYTCQACGFFLRVGTIYIIDCHHKNPLGNGDESRITSIDDLVCLCPACHRIAHTSRPPLLLEEIRKIRNPAAV